MKPPLVVILVLLSFVGRSQEVYVENQYDKLFGAKIAPFLTFRNVLLSEDYLLGGEVGMITPNRDLVLFFGFDARPFRKKVLNYQGSNIFYQNTEERYFVGVGASYMKDFHEKPYGVFAQAELNYTWGVYGGTEQKPPNGWVATPRVGFFWKFTNFTLLKVGYTYLDTKNEEVDKHRLFLALSGILGK